MAHNTEKKPVIYAFNPKENQPISAEIKFNFSTKAVAYYLNGVRRLYEGNLRPDAIANILIFVRGGWDNSQGYVLIDSMGLSIDEEVIPNPEDLK